MSKLLSTLIAWFRFLVIREPSIPAPAPTLPMQIDDKMVAIDGRRFGYSGPIIVIESKESIAYACGDLAKRVDPILATICSVHLGNFYVVVWDLEHFLSHPLRDAVVAHEVGHIVRDAVGFSTEVELIADRHACELGYAYALRQVLQMLLSLGDCNHEAYEQTVARLEAVDRYLMDRYVFSR